ncbi:MAG: hypothetical protein ACR2FX_12655 [Chthoniobacterales bacterium]
MIAVTFALPAESSAFVRRLGERRRDGRIIRGRLSGQAISLFHTGVGALECEKRLRTFLQRERPRVLISSGFCGATRDALVPGDILIAENYSSAELMSAVKRSIPDTTFGRLFSADRVVDPAKDRYAVGREHDAMAIDMESGVIARICREREIPMLSLRVVSDSPAAPFPAPAEVLFDVVAQRTKLSAVFAHLARHPAAAMRLVHFSRQIATARTSLAEALCLTLDVL